MHRVVSSRCYICSQWTYMLLLANALLDRFVELPPS